jgi:hypothetical protein
VTVLTEHDKDAGTPRPPLSAADYDKCFPSEEERDTASDLKKPSGMPPKSAPVSAPPIDTVKD